ncbi:DNA recombination protein RmuC [Emcibacter sp.]|uniref:DNA recombination protein RmuC n=1 Tax=Emcibacter sp. TaxID=1979954 RepID=UPI003A939B6C
MTETHLIAGGAGLFCLLAVLIGFWLAGRRTAALQAQLAQERQRQQEAEARAQESLMRMMQSQSALEGRLAQISEAGAKGQAELTRTLEERLDKVSQRMGESLEKTSKNTTDSLSDLKTRLAVIDEAQKNITELSGQMVGLQDILSNKQARGAFGEVQLNDLVTGILPPNAYGFQETLSNGKRADCLIKLPNPPGSIVVDAKFPLESYHLLRNADGEAQVKQAVAAFRTAIRKHVKDISEKYILNGETAESALMFLPSEAIYAELHATFPELVEESYRAKVWIVSPTTLMATLNTVRAVLKDARMREQAGVIQKEVTTLLTDVDRLDKRVDNLQRHFQQAEKDIADISTSTRKITSRAEKIESLQLEEGESAEAVLETANSQLDKE